MLQCTRYALRLRASSVCYYTTEIPNINNSDIDIYKAHWPRDLLQYTKTAYENPNEAIKFHHDLLQRWPSLPSHSRLSIGLQNLRYISYNDISREGVWKQAVHMLLSQPNLNTKEYYKLIRFIHRPHNMDDKLRQTLLLDVVDRMIEQGVKFNHSILTVIWSKKMQWRDSSFTIKLWQRMYDAGISPDFDILYQALKVSAKRGSVNESQVYLEQIGKIPNVSTYQWKCAQSTFISALEDDVMAAEAYYNSLDTNSYSDKAKLSILGIMAKSNQFTPSRLLEMLNSLPDSSKSIGYASIMRGLALRRLYYDVIGLYNEAVELLDEYAGKYAIGVVHPLLNSLAFRREKYGVWWVWSALLRGRWKVAPNSSTFEITLKASFNQHSKFKGGIGGLYPCKYFIVEAYHNNSLKYHIKELGRGFRAELRDLTLGHHSDVLEHSEMFWRRIEGVFRGLLLSQFPHLHSVNAPVTLTYSAGNWDNLLTKSTPEIDLTSVSIKSEHFDAYVKMLFERRSSGGSYENTNLILQALSWMRELGMAPSKPTLFRCIIALNESISPMFISDIKRIIGASSSSKSVDHQNQLFALDSFNKSADVDRFYKWVSEWLEMPHEMDIFTFWNAEIRRSMD
ncbi:hypothetical protein E3P86_02481 [Wallemia ichthyophaga]|uniref:Uncharacterized protein n=1 Tax=Wallemia ichthyophaga TaxID=245174 RepID=A0A4T0J533_WALIC|nr:hypothetical protein E3P86_02481 [Wallemia ichthyophaga]